MSSIITKGYGVRREAIVTQGYGRSIQEIVIDAIERVTKRKVGSSGVTSRPIEIDQEKCEEYKIFASLTEINDKSLLEPISKEIKKCISNANIGVKIKDLSVSYDKNNIEVKVAIKSIKSKRKATPVITAKKKP